MKRFDWNALGWTMLAFWPLWLFVLACVIAAVAQYGIDRAVLS